MISKITEENIIEAVKIHLQSWKKSHIGVCSEQYLESKTEETQLEYIKSEIEKGKDFYILIKHKPVAIVSIYNNIIENLYVLPDEQGKGYGSELMEYVEKINSENIYLWILSSNKRAEKLYKKRGYIFTGKVNHLKNNFYEREMIKIKQVVLQTNSNMDR